MTAMTMSDGIWRATGRVKTARNLFGQLIFKMEESRLLPEEGCIACGWQRAEKFELRWRTVRPADIDILPAAIMNRSLNMP